MITNNVLHRVFQIRVGSWTGTAFTVDVDQRQYWVTAKHLLDGWCSGDVIEVKRHEEWCPIEMELVGEHPTADVAVLKTPLYLQAAPVDANHGGLIHGQDVFFLGYPHGNGFSVDDAINRGFPVAYVKKACVSAFATDIGDGRDILILDGYNNPGFSGGPVVFRWHSDPVNVLRFAGIVSDYRAEDGPVCFRAPDGGEEETSGFVSINTGLMTCEYIKVATDLIAANPTGSPIPQ